MTGFVIDPRVPQRRQWALIGRKRGNICKSALRPFEAFVRHHPQADTKQNAALARLVREDGPAVARARC
jgi:hypothetical protein